MMSWIADNLLLSMEKFLHSLSMWVLLKILSLSLSPSLFLIFLKHSRSSSSNVARKAAFQHFSWSMPLEFLGRSLAACRASIRFFACILLPLRHRRECQEVSRPEFTLTHSIRSFGSVREKILVDAVKFVRVRMGKESDVLSRFFIPYFIARGKPLWFSFSPFFLFLSLFVLVTKYAIISSHDRNNIIVCLKEQLFSF